MRAVAVLLLPAAAAAGAARSGDDCDSACTSGYDCPDTECGTCIGGKCGSPCGWQCTSDDHCRNSTCSACLQPDPTQPNKICASAPVGCGGTCTSNLNCKAPCSTCDAGKCAAACGGACTSDTECATNTWCSACVNATCQHPVPPPEPTPPPGPPTPPGPPPGAKCNWQCNSSSQCTGEPPCSECNSLTETCRPASVPCGGSCTYDSDCGESDCSFCTSGVCKKSTCAASCSADSDCADCAYCRHGVCIKGACGSECHYDTDCPDYDCPTCYAQKCQVAKRACDSPCDRPEQCGSECPNCKGTPKTCSK